VPRFPHNSKFDALFEKIPDIVWFPYVGEEFGREQRRLLVLAHNVPVSEEVYRRRPDMQHRLFWTKTLDEYTYTPGWWTRTFRLFVKGAVGLEQNFTSVSETSVQERVDAFVRSIAYINFVQGVVVSERQITRASLQQIESSKFINGALLSILEPTHCICWGSHVFAHLSAMQGYRAGDSRPIGPRGFLSRVLHDAEGRAIQVLRVYHPSMPRFSALSPSTHATIAEFLSN